MKPYTNKQLFRRPLVPSRKGLMPGIAPKAGTKDGIFSRGSGVDPDNAHYAAIGRTPILIYSKIFLSDIYRVVEKESGVYLRRRDNKLIGPFSEGTTAEELSEIAYKDLEEATRPQQKAL